MPVQPTLKLLLLGTPQVIYAGQDVTDKLPAKAQAMLYYLAVTGETFSRQALAGLLWGGVSERKALTSLRVALNRIRKVLPDQWEATQQTLAFVPDASSMLDVQVLTACVAENPPDTDSALRQALSLYRDDFLADFFIDDAPQFDEWLDAQRTHFRQLALDGLTRLSTRLMTAYADAYAYADAVEVLQRYLEIQPWDEATHRQLMLAYSRMNRLDAALKQFAQCRRALRDELGVDPMPDTVALHERIETASQAVLHNIPADSTPFVGRSSEVAQIRSQLMDPNCRLLTLLGPGGIGKTRLARHVSRSLVDAEKGVRAFTNGAFWVSLEGVSSPGGIIAAVADAVGFSFYGGVPPLQQLTDFFRSKELLLVLDNLEHLLEGVDVIGTLLAEAPELTVLATSREILNLHAEWTVGIHGLTVPDDSARRTAVEQGRADTLPPLTVESIAESEAVQLFVERARRVETNFPLRVADGLVGLADDGKPGENSALPVELPSQVTQICHLVGGIPLAIELAAAWLRTYNVDDIVRELTHSLDILSAQNDAPDSGHSPEQRERHASMRAVFNHSWQMLEQEEQWVLRRLSVFRNGFDMDAAAVIADASIMDLALFSEKSLLQYEEVQQNSRSENTLRADRYHIHELLRQFAAEMLHERPDEAEATHGSHSTYYLEMLRDQETTLQGPEQQHALFAISLDIENMRAAWRWAIEHEEWSLIEQAMESLYHFYQIRSLYAAGEESFTLLLNRLQEPDLAGRAELHPLRARTLARRGAFLQFICSYEIASVDLVEARQLAEALEMPREQAFALNMLGQIATWQGDRNQAQSLLQRSLAMSRTIGDASGTAYTLEKLANTFYGTFGEYGEDKKLALEALAISREMGRPDWIAYTLDTLGFVTFSLGEYESALAYYQESEALFSEISEPYGLALALGGLGLVYWALGEEYGAQAIEYFERSLALTREIGNRGQDAGRLAGLSRLYNDRGDVASARRAGTEALNIGLSLESPIYIAHAFTCLGDTARIAGDFASGREHLRQSLDIAFESKLLPLMSMALFHYAELLIDESEQASLLVTEQNGMRLQAWQILGHLKSYEPLWHVFQERAAVRHAELGKSLFSPSSYASDPASPVEKTVVLPSLEELVGSILHGI